ncbi:MAG: carbonic anhydrase [Candidatus Micrarchaeota archaeon]|nr:carbonic anhydrase [Candidatus Micrarchaeota archaeon]
MASQGIKYLEYKLNREERRIPYKVIERLMLGNKRFRENKMLDRDMRQEREAVIGGQDPKAVVIECSDSRVPSVLIFDQGIGDLFRLALAGNRIDDNVVASVLYAITYLNTRVVINVAHSSCGAAKAACTMRKSGELFGNELDDLLEHMKAISSTTNFDPDLTAKEHAKFGILELLENKEIRKHVLESNLLLASAFFDLVTGEVTLTSLIYSKLIDGKYEIVITDNIQTGLDDLKKK